MAFAFQLLLTNLGVALGLSALGWAIAPGTETTTVLRSRNSHQPSKSTDGDLKTSESDDALESSDRSTVPPVSHLLGVGVTLTLAPILFITAFLTTTFSGINERLTGLIFGLILWAAYLLILMWISSITVSGILDFVLGTATAGIRRLFSAVEQIFSLNASPSERASEDELKEEIARLSATLKQTLSEQQQLPDLLAQQRETLLGEICDRTNLTQPQAASVLDNLQPDIDIDEEPPANKSAETRITTGEISTEIPTDSEKTTRKNSSATVTQMLPNWRELLRSAVSRIDTSELDIETAWNTFQNFVDDDEAKPFNIIELDAENYLKEAPVYSLQSDTLSEDFSERIYDPEADPAVVKRQLQALTPSDFTAWLKQREDLSARAVEEITDRLGAVQTGVIEELEEKVSQQPTIELEGKIEDDTEQLEEGNALTEEAIAELESKLISYFRYTTLSKLSAQSVEEKLQTQLEELELGQNAWGGDDLDLDFDAIAAVVASRKGITKAQKKTLITALKESWENSKPKPSSTPISRKVNDYLQSIDWSDANLEGFKDEVLQQVQASLVSSKDLSGSIDPDRLMATLSVPDSVKADLLTLLKTEGKPLLKRPRRWVERTAHSSKNWSTALTHQLKTYLQQQDLAAKPEQIKAEASALLKQAAQSIPAEKLPELSADFWQQIVEHRKDLSPDDMNALVNGLSDAWNSATQKLPHINEEIKEQLKTQGIEQWQDVQSAVQALTRFVDDDVLVPVREAIPDLDDMLEPAKQQFVEAIEAAQAGLQQRTALATQELQQKAEQVRHQVAIALWWLFISLFASGASSAAGGWLAVWVRLRSIG